MKTLIETNPYLQDKEQAKILNARSARTSCGVEGIVASSGSNFAAKINTSRSDAVLDRMKKRLRKS
ncbi:TPA: hypothetical protein F7Z59_08025 [Legionella pneumophila]|nr:hypothetical protein [Legionella pneumophila]